MFGVAVLLGLGLGLLVAVSASYLPANHSGKAPYFVLALTPSAGSAASTSHTSEGQNASTAGSASTATSNTVTQYGNGASREVPTSMSELQNLGKQPLAQSLVVLIPLALALIFGLAASRASEAGKRGLAAPA